MRRLLAILLVLAMLPIPAVFGQKVETEEITAADYAAVDALWESLEQVEKQEKATRELRQKVDTKTAVAVAKAAQEHPLYKKNTLKWNGNGWFAFETTVGITCAYSVRLRNEAMQMQESSAVSLELPMTDSETTNTASVRDVYVIQPYYGIDSDFTTQYQKEGQYIAATTGGTCKVLTQNAATVDAVADALEQGAVVIFDSHGETDYMKSYYEPSVNDYLYDCTSGATTSYLLLQTGAGLTADDYASDNGIYHALYYPSSGKMRYYAVDGTCIANHMENNAQNSFLWMAICLGMATDGLHAPLMEKGIGVVYGYSQSVTFGGDYCWEDCFWKQMRKGEEVHTAIAKMKETYGAWDCSRQIYNANNWYKDNWMCSTIGDAQRLLAAFPIVVSAEDSYPGQGNVDNLQTVNSTWKLPVKAVEYKFTAGANDESLGTVSVEGNVVTAVANEHVYIESYTLTPADGCKVVREGDVFVISDLSKDCHLTVNFRMRDRATVNFVVPEGCQMDSIQAYVGESLYLDIPDGTPVADGEEYLFYGWVKEEVTDSTEKPADYLGFFVPEGDTTFYALFAYEDKGVVYYTTNLRMKICYAAQYRDVDLNAWYHEALDFVLEENYMNGTGDGKFTPEGKLTRAMLATILYRMSGDTGEHGHPFRDVPADQWYAEAVAWAYETGVVTGTGADTFDPDGYVTREQTATMFYRYAKLMGENPSAGGNLSIFKDANRISDYAKVPLRWAVGEGIINGKGEGILDPLGTATRAEIAKIIYYWIG